MRIFSFIITAVLLFISLTCSAGTSINIVTTIQPLEFFIEEIGGKHISVTTMVPPGGNPHTYEPTPGQMNAVSSADLYVKLGSGMEFELIWMDRLLSLNRNMTVCDVSQGIELIEMENDTHDHHHNHEQDHHSHGEMDPHIWLSPVNGIIIAENIYDSLSGLNPENAEYYKSRLLLLTENLNHLIKEIESALNSLEKRAFLVFHPSWGYFGRDFNLNQIAVELPGKEITSRRLNSIIKKAKAEEIRVVFASPQFSKKSASVIANEIKGKVIMLDPMKKEYIENLRSVSEALMDGM